MALPEYGGDQYNHQPDNYLVTPSERLSLFATARELGSRAFSTPRAAILLGTFAEIFLAAPQPPPPAEQAAAQVSL